MDDPSVCPYLYTDGLSDELPFFAQARPRRMIRLQYKSGQSRVEIVAVQTTVLYVTKYKKSHFVLLQLIFLLALTEKNACIFKQLFR